MNDQTHKHFFLKNGFWLVIVSAICFLISTIVLVLLSVTSYFGFNHSLPFTASCPTPYFNQKYSNLTLKLEFTFVICIIIAIVHLFLFFFEWRAIVISKDHQVQNQQMPVSIEQSLKQTFLKGLIYSVACLTIILSLSICGSLIEIFIQYGKYSQCTINDINLTPLIILIAFAVFQLIACLIHLVIFSYCNAGQQVDNQKIAVKMEAEPEKDRYISIQRPHVFQETLLQQKLANENELKTIYQTNQPEEQDKSKRQCVMLYVTDQFVYTWPPQANYDNYSPPRIKKKTVEKQEQVNLNNFMTEQKNYISQINERIVEGSQLRDDRKSEEKINFLKELKTKRNDLSIIQKQKPAELVRIIKKKN